MPYDSLMDIVVFGIVKATFRKCKKSDENLFVGSSYCLYRDTRETGLMDELGSDSSVSSVSDDETVKLIPSDYNQVIPMDDEALQPINDGEKAQLQDLDILREEERGRGGVAIVECSNWDTNEQGEGEEEGGGDDESAEYLTGNDALRMATFEPFVRTFDMGVLGYSGICSRVDS